MEATETKRQSWSGEERRKIPSVGKTVASSVAASLICAGVVHFFVFVTTFSKMEVTVENQERRITLLETEIKDYLEDSKKILVEIAKQNQILEHLSVEIRELRKDYRDIVASQRMNKP